MLQWLRANGCEWNEDTCMAAAMGTAHHGHTGGHLEVLQWARANGCACDRTDCLEEAPEGSATREWIEAQPA